MAELSGVRVLTFDLFGTVLDLEGSLTPHIRRFLAAKGSEVSPKEFWQQWRYRQRIEQYQDTIMMLGHSGYLETARKGFVWTLKRYAIEASKKEIEQLMGNWWRLSPFPEVIPALCLLRTKYKLVALSNGDRDLLNHLADKQIKWDFDAVISAETVGAFKPHPGVYRRAAAMLQMEACECMMVSANSFDLVGARSCGYRGAFVDRYKQPFEETPYLPDITAKDFSDLAETLP